jgi:hypothetical protein
MINFSKIMLSGKNIFNVKMIPVYGNPLYLLKTIDASIDQRGAKNANISKNM